MLTSKLFGALYPYGVSQSHLAIIIRNEAYSVDDDNAGLTASLTMAKTLTVTITTKTKTQSLDDDLSSFKEYFVDVNVILAYLLQEFAGFTASLTTA